MSDSLKDPLGQAILDFAERGISHDIIVSSDICEDDSIPSEYLFRNYAAMPELEQIALELCDGKILDIGAGAGIHAEYLRGKGKNVHCIDISPGAVSYLRSKGIPAEQKDFFELNSTKYDCLLLLMNGLGIAGSLSELDKFLSHAKSLLNPGGKIICDSTDIKYLYEDEDGSIWSDLSGEYYGNFNFRMKFKDHQSDWFPWLYVDFLTLKRHAESAGMKIEKVFEEESHYLAILKF